MCGVKRGARRFGGSSPIIDFVRLGVRTCSSSTVARRGRSPSFGITTRHCADDAAVKPKRWTTGDDMEEEESTRPSARDEAWAYRRRGNCRRSTQNCASSGAFSRGMTVAPSEDSEYARAALEAKDEHAGDPERHTASRTGGRRRPVRRRRQGSRSDMSAIGAKQSIEVAKEASRRHADAEAGRQQAGTSACGCRLVSEASCSARGLSGIDSLDAGWHKSQFHSHSWSNSGRPGHHDNTSMFALRRPNEVNG